MPDQEMERKDFNIDADIEKRIIHTLEDGGYSFERDVLVGESSSDFYVETPSGGTAIFEIKSWDPSKENINRARNLASLITSASGVDNTYFVLSNLPTGFNKNNVISASEVIPVLTQQKPKSTATEKPEIKKKPKRKIFAAMPFDPRYDDTFIVAMQPAALSVNLDCIRIDKEPGIADIVFELRKTISKSVGVIADVSESKPNVLYEMGFAEGQKLPVIQICSTPLEQLPFDIRNNRTISYIKGQTNKLKEELVEVLKEIVFK